MAVNNWLSVFNIYVMYKNFLKIKNMKKTKIDLNRLLKQINLGPSKWELDNIVYHDRASNPDTLKSFLKRILELKENQSPSEEQKNELKILLDLANDLDEKESLELLSNSDSIAQQSFIESIARRSALEVMTDKHVSYETMNIMCKLSPDDFILASKRTQDLINAIHELVIQGETLSADIAGA
jgi:uncharacterized protein YjgD (DUF1641 family)